MAARGERPVRTWTDDDVREANRRERAAQGLPEQVEDPVVLDRIAALLRPRSERGAS